MFLWLKNTQQFIHLQEIIDSRLLRIIFVWVFYFISFKKLPKAYFFKTFFLLNLKEGCRKNQSINQKK
jgi:hypothetical protein